MRKRGRARNLVKLAQLLGLPENLTGTDEQLIGMIQMSVLTCARERDRAAGEAAQAKDCLTKVTNAIRLARKEAQNATCDSGELKDFWRGVSEGLFTPMLIIERYWSENTANPCGWQATCRQT